MDGLARIELARLEQPRHVAIELVHARKEIDHDETLHPDPRADRPREIAQFGRPRVVVDVDHTAQGKARAFLRNRERGIEMIAADIIKIDVDPVRPRPAPRPPQILFGLIKIGQPPGRENMYTTLL